MLLIDIALIALIAITLTVISVITVRAIASMIETRRWMKEDQAENARFLANK